jgi:hypothetical protein
LELLILLLLNLFLYHYSFKTTFMYRLSYLLVLLLFASVVYAQQNKKSGKQKQEYVELRVYHAADTQQVRSIENYLQANLLPRLGNKGFNRIGVFTAIGNDTASDKRVYVLIPFSSLTQLDQLASQADESVMDSSQTGDYGNALYNHPPFLRLETIVLRTFEAMPKVQPSALTSKTSERVYELRSYESATEALHQNKVHMFNSGEVGLFQRLGFNAVFYGRVLAGCRMPNLMYMTSFANKASRDEHWKTFGGDPEWKALSSKPEYQHNVSKSDIIFLRPASFSQL